MSSEPDDEKVRKRSRLEPTDVQAAKMELLRMGRERGFVEEDEIEAALPSSMITPAELETFFFTLDMMDIKVKLRDGSTRKPSSLAQ